MPSDTDEDDFNELLPDDGRALDFGDKAREPEHTFEEDFSKELEDLEDLDIEDTGEDIETLDENDIEDLDKGLEEWLNEGGKV